MTNEDETVWIVFNGEIYNYREVRERLLAKGHVFRSHSDTEVIIHLYEEHGPAMVNQLVLRTQAQAAYSPDNIGHFGLSLRRYAHFTSPIRRYADLLVHRALIAGHRFGPDGLPQPPENFTELGEHISTTERRAAAAEQFSARIGGVTRAGLFVTLAETGADGFIPMRSLGDDYYIHDEVRHCLRGRRTGRTYTLGDAVTVKLGEADTVTGSLLFSLVEESPPRPAQHGQSRPQHRQKRRR